MPFWLAAMCPPLPLILSDIKAKLDLIRTKVAVIPSTSL